MGKVSYEGNSVPRWALDRSLTMESKLRRWVVVAMCRQREITYQDIGEKMGVSHQRVFQIIDRGTIEGLDEIEDAITEITEEKHRAMGHTDDDSVCTVYTVAFRKEPEEVRAAKIAAEKERIEECRKLFD
jgi:predicted transcriptional regulator